MPFKLKDQYPAFQIVEGPFAYHTFRHGQLYECIPEELEEKFEEIGKVIIQKGGEE